MDVSVDTWIKLLTLFGTILAGLIKHFYEAKPRLVAYYTHVASFKGWGLKATSLTPPATDATAAAPAEPPEPTHEGVDNEAIAKADTTTNEAPEIAGGAAEPPVICTHSIAIRNMGNRTAKNVRIGHRLRPLSVSMDPRVYCQTADGPYGGWEIWAPTLVPGESLQLGYMYPPKYTFLDFNTYVKSDEAAAEIISLDAIAVRPLPVWRVWSRRVLVVIGTAAAIYWTLTIGLWLFRMSGGEVALHS